MGMLQYIMKQGLSKNMGHSHRNTGKGAIFQARSVFDGLPDKWCLL